MHRNKELNEKLRDEHGFTLIELLVVMIIIGILAAIAIPAAINQKSKARETSAKSDVKQIAQEIVGYYVGGKGALTLTGVPPAWQLTNSAVAPVASGRLSDGNTISATGNITSEDSYCVAVRPALSGAKPWHVTQAGLQAGDC